MKHVMRASPFADAQRLRAAHAAHDEAEPAVSQPDLALLLDADDLAALDAAGVAPRRIVACDPELHCLLDERGIEHDTPWTFVRADDFSAIRRREADLIAHWRKHAVATYLGVNLLEAAGFRHISAMSRLVWCEAVALRAIDALKPRSVVVLDEAGGHALLQPPDHRLFPLLQAIFAGAAQMRGVEIQLVRRGASGAFRDVVASAAQRDRNSPAAERAELPARNFLLFHGNGIDLDRQRELAAVLRSRGDVTLIHLHRNSTPDRVAALDSVFDHALNELDLARPAPPRVVELLQQSARDGWSRGLTDANEHVRATLSNPGVRRHFDFIFGDYLSRIADHVETWSAFFDAHRPRALVTHFQAPIIDVAVACGVPTIVLPHGSNMGFAEWYRSMPRCTVGVISNTQRDQLRAAGVDESRLVVSGDAWLDRFTGEPLASQVARARLGLDSSRPTIAFCTSQLGWIASQEMLPTVNWRLAIETMKALAEFAGSRPQWQFIVKCHPRYDHHDLYARLFSLAPNVRVRRHESIGLVADAADAIVFCNVISSAVVDCALRGRPTWLLCDSMVNYRRDEWGLDRWPHLTSTLRLEKRIDAVLSDTAVWEQELALTRVGLAHYLDGAPTDAAQAAATLAARLADEPPVGLPALPSGDSR